MAHIHLEDGSFSLSWVLIWWIAALLLISVALWSLRSKGSKNQKQITIAAFVAAAAFAVFQINIPLFGGVHLNLTPLIGILVGPVLGTLVILVINILSAAIGHGGWGLVGANVLINVSEVIVAYLIFRGFRVARAAPAEFMEFEADLDTAVREQQFEMWFQPMVRLRDGALVRAEALLRWRHPSRGLLRPNLFVPLLEDTGLIVTLGWRTIGAACRALAAWPGD